MKVVLDVNVWISALLWGGLPLKILYFARQKRLTIFVSESLLKELEVTLRREKFKKQLEKLNHPVEYFMIVTQGFSEKCSPLSIYIPELRDSKDNHILATAVAANAKVLITGDQDLLVLRNFAGIVIMTPTDFINNYFSSSSPDR